MKIARSIQSAMRVVAAGAFAPILRRMYWLAFNGNSIGKQEESR
jgi:hypothetical protein